jgi:PmbA protein
MTETLDEINKNIVNQIDIACKKLGIISEIKDWEIFAGCKLSAGFKIEKGFMKRSSVSMHSGITFRFFGEQGKTGSAFVSRISNNIIDDCVDRAIKMMRHSLPNPEYVGLAKHTEKYPKVKTPWDPEIESIKMEDSVKLVQNFMGQMKRDPRIKSISGHFGYSDNRFNLLNSNNILLKDKQTSASLSAEIVMEEIIDGKKENSNGFDAQAYNYFKELEPDKIFNKAYQMACQGIRKTKIETKSYPVILTPGAVDKLFCEAIFEAIDAQAIYEKRSFLQNMLNKKIGSQKLTIKDNPWLKGGIATSSYDAEGTPTKPIDVIKEGVLKSFLHNVYTANLFKTESTGHATRSLSSPSIDIGPSNIIIEAGKSKKDELFSSVKEGVLIQYTHDQPNITTGEFSGLIATGNLINDGQITLGLQEAMIGTKLLDLYGKIEDISVEVEREGSSYVPFIKISDLLISGPK